MSATSRRRASAAHRVTVPLALERLPADGRLRTLVSQLVQLRPVLEDPTRELWLELPSGAVELVRLPAPEPDPERPVLFDDEVKVTRGVSARVTVAAARDRSRREPRAPLAWAAWSSAPGAPRTSRPSRDTRACPGTRHLYGEVRCDALEELQRAALDRPRPQLVVKVDRSGLNDNHPVVRALYAAIDRVLRPIVAEEERHAGATWFAPAGRCERATRLACARSTTR